MTQIEFLQREAAVCRQAANGLPPQCEERRGLEQLARHYEQEARRANLVQLRPNA